MKFPETVTLVRHDESVFNAKRALREAHPAYASFKESFEKNPESDRTRSLALEVRGMFPVDFGDHQTPLANEGIQAKKMAAQLKDKIGLPDIVFVSPFERTQATLKSMQEGWPELGDVRTLEEERIRERDHGLSLIYNDWRVFAALNPEQRMLRERESKYWYRFPNGENIPDVRERLRSWTNTLTRDYSERGVLAVTHNLVILSFRSNMERLDGQEFERLDREEEPINAGVTIYRGDPNLGTDGKLVLDAYNLKLY